MLNLVDDKMTKTIFFEEMKGREREKSKICLIHFMLALPNLAHLFTGFSDGKWFQQKTNSKYEANNTCI